MGKHAIRSLRGGFVVAALGLLIGALALIGPSATPSSAAAPNKASAARTDVAGRSDCKEERNVQVVLAALQVVFSEHRVDQVDQFFADDFVQFSPYAAPGGREELKQWWAGIVYAIPDVITDVTQTVAKCTDVVTFRTVRGTILHDLPAFGITGEGQHIEFRVADIFRVRDGKITAHWEVADTGPLLTVAATS